MKAHLLLIFSGLLIILPKFVSDFCARTTTPILLSCLSVDDVFQGHFSEEIVVPGRMDSSVVCVWLAEPEVAIKFLVVAAAVECYLYFQSFSFLALCINPLISI